MQFYGITEMLNTDFKANGIYLTWLMWVHLQLKMLHFRIRLYIFLISSSVYACVCVCVKVLFFRIFFGFCKTTWMHSKKVEQCGFSFSENASVLQLRNHLSNSPYDNLVRICLSIVWERFNFIICKSERTFQQLCVVFDTI